MQLLIAGGTGTSGRALARRAAAAGHHPRVLTRRTSRGTPDGQRLVHGDLTTGTGLDEAVDGVDAVVDLSNISTARYQPAKAFFTTATEHLFAAEQRAGTPHHLTLSIVGVDRFPSAYYRAKLDQEAAVVAASIRTGVATASSGPPSSTTSWRWSCSGSASVAWSSPRRCTANLCTSTTSQTTCSTC